MKPLRNSPSLHKGIDIYFDKWGKKYISVPAVLVACVEMKKKKW